ncbi:MAG: hypothetical protein WD847_16485 [Pirellulales bacterium]
MQRALIIVLLLVFGLVGFVPLPGITIAFSGESFVAGDHQVIIEYGYSRWSGRLLYAVVQTWPKDATVIEKQNDPRVGRNFFEWTMVRDHDGRMKPVGTNGEVYFFEAARLKTLRVRMTESEDTAWIGNSTTIDEVWACFLPFRTE